MGIGDTWMQRIGLEVEVPGHQKKNKSANGTDLPGTGLGQSPLNSP